MYQHGAKQYWTLQNGEQRGRLCDYDRSSQLQPVFGNMLDIEESIFEWVDEWRFQGLQ